MQRCFDHEKRLEHVPSPQIIGRASPPGTVSAISHDAQAPKTRCGLNPMRKEATSEMAIVNERISLLSLICFV